MIHPKDTEGNTGDSPSEELPRGVQDFRHAVYSVAKSLMIGESGSCWSIKKPGVGQIFHFYI